MCSERRVTAATTVKCVSSAYAKLMLCLPLPLAPAGRCSWGSWGACLREDLRKIFSKAYAVHMEYIRVDEDGDENLERG
jgi:hypothetical protein